MFSVFKVQQLKKGKIVKLSAKEIVNLNINLLDAKKNLNENDFQKVHQLYCAFSELTHKKTFDLKSYLEMASSMIAEFEKIAPYHYYSGNR